VTLPGSRLALALLAIAALAVGIDNMERPLANPDEGRYSEISREMAASGDWVTPRLNGIKYFEKPPLQYWATAAAFKALGENHYAARLYVGLAGMATILIVGFTAFRVRGIEAAVATVLAIVSCPYFMAMGGIVTLDMGLTLWTTATFCALVLAEEARERPREHRAWMLAAWVAMALAVLSKGLVGIVFPGALLAMHCLLARDFSILRRIEWTRGFPLFLVIAAPWFIAVSHANPEFAQFFFVHEHFDRFLTSEHRRVEPWWYFIPIVVFGFLPWMFALPSAIFHAWRAERGAAFQPYRMALLWCGFIFVFFSGSGSKLPAYVLPLFPVLALVLGRYLVEAPARKLAIWSALILPIAIVLAWVAWHYPETARDAWTLALYRAAQPWAVGAACVLIATSLFATFFLRRGRRWAALIGVALASVLMIEALEDGYEQLTPRQSGYGVAQKMRAVLTPATRVYSVHHYEQTVPFYLGRTVTLVDYLDEFETGMDAEPGRDIRKLANFPREWLREGDALAIMHPGIFEKLKAQGLPMQVLHQDPRRVLVRKP
jgi:4-amino-4-deoxy-L-arabinose transferase-like glycosyltransferase